MGVSYPGFSDRIVALAGTARCWPHGRVRLAAQIAAIESDTAFRGGDYAAPPKQGIHLFGLIWAGRLTSQQWWHDKLWKGPTWPPDDSYESVGYFSDSLFAGLDANDLILQAETWQHHDVGATPGFDGSIERALASIRARVLYLPGRTDLYFPVSDARAEARLIPHVDLGPIPSLWGHVAAAGRRSRAERYLGRTPPTSPGSGGRARPDRVVLPRRIPANQPSRDPLFEGTMSDLARLSTALEERYRIERQLGAGGMATVYLATDLKHDREVALKVLRPELGAVLGAERFLAEIKITARLDHPHILTLIDSGAEGGFLYYVLPLVRGESLRDKLNREHQLGLEEALTITRQVASALDYAHRHGVVHRDIKPENILLLEGEAMLADFGIALAVSEAGGNRLTETGLSLGTPQYMSPEQATGDRQLDARSDLYSLAAVLYEMLAGEPPVTGPTAQAMIAKLMTERPVHLRVVRSSVPEAIDAAVARALDKTPADRFASAGEFARALDAKPVAPTVVLPAPRSRRRLVVGIAAGVAVLAAVVGGFIAIGRLGARGPSFALRDRTQLTLTGSVYASAVSADGKQLAYITHNCDAKGCSYSVDVQDVGGSATHRVLEGASAAYGLEWSPDRRNLILVGTWKGRWGYYLVSALGGPPRHLSTGAAMFWAGGDSLLIGPPVTGGDSVFQVKVASIDGTVRDSIRVAGPGQGLAGLSVSPGGRWIVALVVQAGRGFWQVFDRNGKVADHVVNSCTCPGRITGDALWLTRSGVGFESIVRIGIDPSNGRLATRQDTLLSGNFNNFSVTADGSTLVIDDGTQDYSLWALGLPEALKGKFIDTERLAKASTRLGAQLSSDGGRLLLVRNRPSTAGASERRYSVVPFGGGGETPLNLPGALRSVNWVDSVTLAVSTQTATGVRIGLVDVRTGASGRSVDIPDSLVQSVVPLPDGWAWIPATLDRVVVQRGGKTAEIKKPVWFGEFNSMAADVKGQRLALLGWNAGTYDSMGVAVVSVDGGTPSMWTVSAAEQGAARFLDDGSLLFAPWDTPESALLYKVDGPGRTELLGKVPRPIAGISVSRDLKRVVVLESNYHGDAYMSRIVRP